MGFNQKLTFSSIEIEAETENLPLNTNTYGPPAGVGFIQVNTANVDDLLRPSIAERFAVTADLVNPNRFDVLYIPGSATDWRESHLAVSFGSGAFILVRTYLWNWITERDNLGLPYHPWPDEGNATNYEVKILTTGALTGPVSWTEISLAEWSAGTRPEGFTAIRSTLPGFSIYGELEARGQTSDIELLPEEGDPGSRTDVVTFLTRFNAQILKRFTFEYDGLEFELSRVDYVDGGRKLRITGSREVEATIGT